MKQQQMLIMRKKTNQNVTSELFFSTIYFSTDELIQKTIRNKFKESTVLTVAHRLRTVIDNDRIMVKWIIFYFQIVFCILKVLGNGELLEFDTPSVLLSNAKSHLVSLVEQTGRSEAEYLRKLANRKDLTNNQNQIVDDELILSADETDPLLV